MKGGQRVGVSLTRQDDRKNVLLLSSATNPLQTGSARRLVTEGSEGTRVKTLLTAPSALEVYQKFMGAVDRVDQSLSYLRVTRMRHRKPWKVLFFDLFDIVVHNCFILDRRYVDNGILYASFRRKLAEEIIGQFSSGIARIRRTQRQLDEGHWPLPTTIQIRRGRCSFDGCKMNTYFFCSCCVKYFFVNINRLCFTLFHKRLFHIE
jgi:hypothetical protein